MSKEIRLNENDVALIAEESERTGRHWTEILKGKIALVSSSSGNVTQQQKQVGVRLIERCRQIGTPVDGPNPSTNIDKILYEWNR